MLKHKMTLAVLLGLALSAKTGAQEWPRFRGVNGTGVSNTNLPATFTAKDITWKITLPGEGHSSPVLWGDRIFLTCCESETARRFIVCVNANDGSIRWKREYPSVTYRQHNDNSYASSTPAVDADHVYVCWSTPQEYALIALDHDGKDAWKVGLGPYTSQHGSGTSPVVVNDLVILSNDQEGPKSFLLAVDRKTGKERWRVERHGNSMSAATPIVHHTKDAVDEVIFTQRQEGITAVNAMDGKVLWSVNNAFNKRTVGSPFMAGDLVIGTCGEGTRGGVMVAANPDSVANGKAAIAWKSESATPYVPTPVSKGDLTFLWNDMGTVTCIKSATGEQVWQEKVGGAYYTSPIIAGDKIFCVSKKGEVVAIAASDKYQLLGRSQLGELTHATPAIAGGRIFYRTLTHLICVGGKQAG